MPRKLSLVAGLAVLSLAAFAPAADAAAPPAKSMVLSPSDVPGYDLASGQYVSNAELKAKNPAWKNFATLGRITGYNAAYTGLGVAGLTEIDTFASLYKTGVGAHNSLVLTLVQAHEQNGTVLLSTTAKSLGSDALVYRMKGTTPNEALYTVAWRRGSVFAEVIGGGRSGTVDAAEVVALAKKQDSRISKALARP
jgi:hypothetical protein